MNINKKIPVWLMIPLDLLLVAAIILPFAYFHHVRSMWGISGSEEVQKNYEPTILPSFDTTEVFQTFLPSGSAAVILNGDEAIRAYEKEAGITPMSGSGVKMLSFYRSDSILTTLYSITEKLGNNKAHKYYVYDVYVKSIKNFYTVAGRQKNIHELISEGEEYAGGTVIAAVNGDYSSNTNHCRVLLRNGELFHNNQPYDSDLCVMYYDGTIETYEHSEFDFEAVEAKIPYQIWDFGPELLDKDGKAKTEFDMAAYDRHIITREHPRTALGYYAPGHYCFVIVDGRQKDDDNKTDLVGLSIKDLAALMERLGCKRAYNMDGGDSTQAYMNGVDVRIDKERQEQRVLSDIICVGEYTEKEKEEGV